MTDAEIIRSILADVRTAYGENLNAPDYRKVVKSLSLNLYSNIIDRIKLHGVNAIEYTDANDDVSRQIVIGSKGEEIAMGLSVVGPYASVRALRSDGKSTWITGENKTLSNLCEFIMNILEEFRITVIDRKIAATYLPMKMLNQEKQATVYQALFTDTDVIP